MNGSLTTSTSQRSRSSTRRVEVADLVRDRGGRGRVGHQADADRLHSGALPMLTPHRRRAGQDQSVLTRRSRLSSSLVHPATMRSVQTSRQWLASMMTSVPLSVRSSLTTVRCSYGSMPGTKSINERYAKQGRLDHLRELLVGRRRQRHPGLLHECDLVGTGGGHRVVQRAAGAKVEDVDGGREAVRCPPPTDSFRRGPELPDPLGRSREAAAENDVAVGHGGSSCGCRGEVHR